MGMDLWEANRAATAYTAHPCSLDSSYRCEGEECDVQCDKPGCDFNSYRMGDRGFYGPGSEYALNSLKPFTIVTQFLTADGTDSGDLSEIRRFYMQDGKRIDNSKATWEGLRGRGHNRPVRRNEADGRSSCSWHDSCSLPLG